MFVEDWIWYNLCQYGWWDDGAVGQKMKINPAINTMHAEFAKLVVLNKTSHNNKIYISVLLLMFV